MSDNRPVSAGAIGLDLELNTKEFIAQLGGITRIAKNAAKGIAAAFTVKKLFDFGKEAVSLGSDLNEVQNVVNVTFQSMSDDVNSFAREAQKSFGLSETMAKQYMGTFGAMSKAFGFSEQQAYDMSAALTGLAGDVASFYNLSQDQAYTKLKSVFTGETESLKDLGVVMTQTALDSYALANGFGKTTKSMSEAEKVALRFSFVQEQLSLASGDFARTSGGWANQVKILQLQIQSFAATVGQGLINMLTPVIRMLNILMEKLVTLAGVFKAVTEVFFGAEEATGTAKAATAVGSAMSGAGTAAKKAAKEVQGALASFDQLKVLDTGTSEEEVSGAGTGMNLSIPSFELGTGSTVSPDVVESAEKIKAIYGQAKNWIQNNVQPIFRSAWNTIHDGWMKWGKPALEQLGIVAQHGKDALLDIWDVLYNGWKEWGTPVFEGLRSAARNTGEIIKSVWINTIWPVLENFMESADWLWENHLLPLLENFVDFAGTFVDSALRIYNECIAPLIEWFSEIFGPVVAEVINTLVNLARSATAMLAELVGNGILQTLQGLLDFLTGVFTGDWDRAWKGIVEIFRGVFGGIEAIAKGIINGVIDLINTMLRAIIDGMNEVISRLNRIHVSIPDWVPGLGGKSFGISIPKIAEYQIPKLATGAVIPPNSEFLAMLGDQKSGRNLEAPESLIRQIVREETAALGGDVYITIEANADEAQFIRYMNLKLKKEENRRGKTVIKGALT